MLAKPGTGWRAVWLGIAVVLGVSLVACADDSQTAGSQVQNPSDLDQQNFQAPASMTVFGRIDIPVDEFGRPTESATDLTGRLVEFVIASQAPGESRRMAPVFWDPYYGDGARGDYVDHLAADLTEAVHLCSSNPAEHCLVAIVTYRPCQPATDCDQDRVLEIAMVKVHGDWIALIVDNFDPSLDAEALESYVGQAASLYALNHGRGLNEVHWRSADDKPEATWTLHQTLETRLNRYNNAARATDEPPAPIADQDGYLGNLADAIVEIYWSAVESISMPPQIPAGA